MTTPLGPFELFLRSDAAVQLAGVACLVGWLAGVALVLIGGWRRLTRPADGTVRALRMALDDANAHVTVLTHRNDALMRDLDAQRALIDSQTVQIGQLFRDSERMARLYADASAARKGAA